MDLHASHFKYHNREIRPEPNMKVMTTGDYPPGAFGQWATSIFTELSWFALVMKACVRAKDLELRYSAHHWPSCVRQPRRLTSERHVSDNEVTIVVSGSESSTADVAGAASTVGFRTMGIWKSAMRKHMAKVICKLCGQKGHWSPACPNRQKRH
ncbi:hypothetical protein N9L68_00680 [bacterium]|nr:hypothetical protein [bacterium]